MKTTSLTKILILVGLILASTTAQAQKSAASNKLDLELHYDISPKPLPTDGQIGPQQEPSKKAALNSANVQEQKNISPEDSRHLANPYHRTLRTGLSF